MFAQQTDQGKRRDNERMDKKKCRLRGMLAKKGEELKDEQVKVT